MKRAVLLLIAAFSFQLSAFPQGAGYSLTSGSGGATLPTTTSLLKGDGAGGAAAATAGTDFASVAQGALAASAVQPSTAPVLTGTNFTAIPESAVTSLTTDLAAKAPLASPTFTGTPTINSTVTKFADASNLYGFELNQTRATALGLTPLPYLRPVTNNTGMILDLSPRGTTADVYSTGKCWIDVIDADLVASSSAVWHGAAMGIRSDSATIGSKAGGSGSAQLQLRIHGPLFAFTSSILTEALIRMLPYSAQSTSGLMGGLALYSDATNVNGFGATNFGIFEGYNTADSKYTTRLLAPSDSQISFGKHAATTTPTAQSSFTDVLTMDFATDALWLRDSTNPTAIYVANTYTDSSNYERGFLRWNGNILEIGGDKLGTGTARNTRFKSANDIYLDAGSGRSMLFLNNGVSNGVTVDSTGNIAANKLTIASTVTGAGTTGAQTINKARGTVRFAVGATTLVVTDSMIASTSKIRAYPIGAFDATATNFTCTAASGSFTITANAAATAETEVGFDLVIP